MEMTTSLVPSYIIVVNTMLTSFVVAGVFFWLWFSDRKERSFPLWGIFFVATGLVMVARIGPLERSAAGLHLEMFLGGARLVLAWVAICEFTGNHLKAPWTTALAVVVVNWVLSALAAGGVLPVMLPYLIGGVLYVISAFVMLRQGYREPGLGYGVAGWMMVLFVGFGLTAPLWLSGPTDPKSYMVGPIFNFGLGLMILVITSRKQQRISSLANKNLQHEANARQLAQEEGKLSSERYRAILDSTRSLIGLLAPDGTVLDANRTAIEHGGIKHGDIVGKRFWETVWWMQDQPQQQRMREAIRRVAAGGNDNFVSRSLGPDGNPRYMNFFLTPIRDDEGQVVYLVPEGHDITERKKMEQTLHMAEQRFRAISENSLLGVFATDKHGDLAYINGRSCEILELSKADAYAGRWMDALHPADRPRLDAEMGGAARQHRSFSSERHHIAKSGTVVWTRTHIAPIIEAGEPQGFVGTIEDITLRKVAEQALRDSQEKFASFFALTPEPIAVTRHPDGIFVDANEAWLKAFDFRAHEVNGKDSLTLGLWREPKEYERLFAELLRLGELPSSEVYMRRRNGEDVTVLVSARLIHLEQSKLILWNMHDITAQRRMEQNLSDREAQFAQLFKLWAEPLVLMRRVDHHIVDVSEAWLKTFAYKRDEVIGRTPQELNLMWSATQADQFQRLLEHGDLHHVEEWLTTKVGARILVEMTARSFELNNVGYIFWLAHDITERRRVELSLRESEERIAAIFQHSPEALGITSLESGVFIDVNKAWTEQFGHSRENVLGKTSLDIKLWQDAERRTGWFDEALANMSVTQREVRLRRADGTELRCKLSGNILKLDGRLVLIWRAQDITERCELAQAHRDIGSQP